MADVVDASAYAQEQQAILSAVLMLLYEKQDNQLTRWIEQFIKERHEKFHDSTIPWTECGNEHCQNTRDMLISAKKPEVLMTPLSLVAYREFGIKFKGMGTGIIIRLIKPEDRAGIAPLVKLTDA